MMSSVGSGASRANKIVNLFNLIIKDFYAIISKDLLSKFLKVTSAT